MAELESSTALVPTGGSFQIKAREFDAAGKSTDLTIDIPDSIDFESWSVMQQVVMLKKGPWDKQSVSDILWGLAYAKRIGADVMKGDLFPTGQGRWGTSNKYKIRMAMATGNVTSLETRMEELDAAAPAGCKAEHDLECTVTIGVKGWEKPIVRTARLSRWFKKSNPNWVDNPEHMLELNTIAHACEYVPGAPLATEEDEAPPPPPGVVAGLRAKPDDLLGKLEESVKMAEGKSKPELVTK